MARLRKPKQPKQPKYVLVNKDTDEGKGVYKLLLDTLKKWHSYLREARIVAAWMVGQKRDRDGRLVLGKMKKASELDRQLHEFDLVLLLNREMWRIFSEAQRTALVDHELCHADQALDSDGEQTLDAHGRALFRIRKHDLEEFSTVVRRHGVWKADLEAFADALDEGRQLHLPTAAAKSKAAANGATVSVNGGKEHPLGSPEAKEEIRKSVARMVPGRGARA